MDQLLLLVAEATVWALWKFTLLLVGTHWRQATPAAASVTCSTERASTAPWMPLSPTNLPQKQAADSHESRSPCPTRPRAHPIPLHHGCPTPR